MDLTSFRRLLSPDGQAVLAEAVALAPTEATLLSCHQRLRKRFPDDLVKAALETALLRRKAADKFTRTAEMYFTREALEQSSGEIISSYRACRFAGHNRVADLCCGIGGDAISLSGVADVIAADLDPLRLAMAEENVKAYGRIAMVVLGDVTTVPLPALDAAFLDPDRRADGKRHIRIRDYVPALEAVRARFPAAFPLGVKVAPGVPWDELRTFDAEVEFISVGGELKECVLWFGPLKTVGRRATVLPPGFHLFADAPAPPADPDPPLAYLYDPDPAVVRSGLVSDLGRQLDARPIDADIAYLTGDRLVATAFAKAYRIEESLPFHAKRIGERLKALNVGHVTLTKRGSPVDVDELRRKWKLTGTEARTVILTKVMSEPWALIAVPV